MKKESELPPEFVAKCKAITAKRPRTVIDHVLKHGFITTQDLKETYGYNHPPRAAMDVKDVGIPMVMVRVKGTDGRSVAAYEFGDPEKARTDKYFGRTVLGKKLKASLLKTDGAKCAIYLEPYPENKLQTDHRIPFQVSGDDPAIDQKPEDYMLLSPSANRAKSWSCEHCENFKNLKDPDICVHCYWAYPDDYEHVAMKQIRRLDLMWTGEETEEYDAIKKKALDEGQKLPRFVKDVLRKLSNLG